MTIIEEVRRAVKLEDFVPGLNRGRALCPFHLSQRPDSKRAPSFQVYDDEHGHCHACGWHGDVIDFTMKRDGIGFLEALQQLAGDAGIKPEDRKRRRTGRTRRPSILTISTDPDFGDRVLARVKATTDDALAPHAMILGFTVASLRRLDAFVSPRWPTALCIPMRRPTSGRVVGIRVRSRSGKKWSVKGSRSALFIPSGVDPDPLFVVEGPTDNGAMIELGLSCIGRPDAGNAWNDVVRVAHGRDVVLLADRDDVGMQSADALAHRVLGYARRVRLLVPLAKDARAWIRNGATRLKVEEHLDVHGVEYHIEWGGARR